MNQTTKETLFSVVLSDISYQAAEYLRSVYILENWVNTLYRDDAPETTTSTSNTEKGPSGTVFEKLRKLSDELGNTNSRLNKIIGRMNEIV